VTHSRPKNTAIRFFSRFSLRALLLAVTVCACLFAWQSNRQRAHNKCVAKLDELGVRYTLTKTLDEKWIDQIPGFGTPPTFKSVYVSKHGEYTFSAAIDALKGQRIDALHLSGGGDSINGKWVPYLTAKRFERLEKIAEIVQIKVDCQLSIDQLRGVAGIQTLRRIDSVGSIGGIDQAGFEFLLTLPNIKAIGSPHGGSEVPDELKKTRPDVKYYQTDSPP